MNYEIGKGNRFLQVRADDPRPDAGLLQALR